MNVKVWTVWVHIVYVTKINELDYVYLDIMQIYCLHMPVEPK